ncbi:MAG: hypothetical protein IID46_09615 [Planctomycetes bacterium]|nr:hypothetical protein [Planctomycetota bacterium]
MTYHETRMVQRFSSETCFKTPEKYEAKASNSRWQAAGVVFSAIVL